MTFDPVHACVLAFQGLYPVDQAGRTALEQLARVQTMVRGETIQPAGQPCRTLYFVSEGSVRIHSVPDGHDVTERIVLAGGFADSTSGVRLDKVHISGYLDTYLGIGKVAPWAVASYTVWF